jgi:hypothetical protein
MHSAHNALLISVIDVESRWVLKWMLAWSIPEGHVVNLFNAILKHYPQCNMFSL